VYQFNGTGVRSPLVHMVHPNRLAWQFVSQIIERKIQNMKVQI